MYSYDSYIGDEKPDGFHLEQTLPLQSMAEPETLSDFVRWGAENYPAKKYALVLWDHGGGSKTGLFIDELFDGDVMYLYELGDALRASGIHLEAVLFDACLMAGLETAYAISDTADWMIASEELMAGRGTAVANWLQQLYISPELNGEWLGRWICDMTQIKYVEEGDEQAQQLLTWSVIDLRHIPRLVELVDAGYKGVCTIYVNYPKLMSMYAKYAVNVEHYGTNEGDEKMWDLADMLYFPSMSMLTPDDVYYEILQALKDTVVYCVRGPGRSAARGLSYCYATGFDIEELNIYCRNCPMPHYLALLDAITPWTAPDWVYEKAERLPEMDSLEGYRVKARKVMLPDNTPALTFDEDNYLGASSICYNAYKRVEDSDDIIFVGTMPAYCDENGVFQAVEPWMWPALEGQHIASTAVDLVEPGETEYLGSFPIQIGSEMWQLRYGYFMEDDHYTVYGFWNGYDANSSQFNRNVKSLSQMAGRQYRLVYPVYSGDYEKPTEYAVAEPQTIYRAMTIEDKPAPPGTYYLEYVVYDMFMRPMPLEWIEINWDGETASIPEGLAWDGEVELHVPDDLLN